jgi:hypothetical protein
MTDVDLTADPEPTYDGNDGPNYLDTSTSCPDCDGNHDWQDCRKADCGE